MRAKYSFPSFLLLGLLALGAKTLGQNAGHADQTPTFKSKTEYVEVPVLVQRSGKHVGALNKADFVIEQDGKLQNIVSFEEVHAAKPFKQETNGVFRNSYAAGQAQPQITIIAFDTINTPVLDQAYFKQELIQYLNEVKSVNEPVGLLSFNRSGIRVLHDFTSDPKSILAAAEKLNTQPATNNDSSGLLSKMASAQEQVGSDVSDVGPLINSEERMVVFQDVSARIDTLLALQQLAQALKGIPGRKTLIWVGSGIQFMSGPMELTARLWYKQNPQRLSETTEQHTYTWKLLNDANIAVYPIDTRRTTNVAYQAMDPSQQLTAAGKAGAGMQENETQTIATFKSMAAETGGKPCIYRTDLHNCLKEAAEDNHDYYLLGFYADKDNKKPGWHKINVKLNQKASLHFRQGFLIMEMKPDATRQTDLQLALNSPYSYTSLPFEGKFTGFTENGKNKTTGFEMMVPPGSITIEQGDKNINIDFVAVVRGVGGKEAARFGQRINRTLSPDDIADIKANGIDYKSKVELPPGEYRVWFVVRDNPTGRTGSVIAPLKVP